MTRWKLPRRRAAHGSESGLTLVEVVISVVLLSMITGAIGAAFITGFNGVRPSQQRVRESNDAQVIASFLVRDAQSAGGSNPSTGTVDPMLGVSSPGSAPDCTGPSGTVVLRFAWREYTPSANPNLPATSKLWVANYSFDASPTADTLVRRTCVDGVNDSETELAGFVASIDDGHGNSNRASCIAADGSEAPCPVSPAATLPDRVRVHITETNADNPSPTPYDYTLTASLRPESQTLPTSSDSTPVPLLTLGGCSPTPGIDLQGSPDVVVYGGVAINNNCNSIDVGSGATFNATGGVTMPVPPIPDPYASLTPPPVDCVNGTHTGTNGPGTYKTSVTFSGLTLSPGIYIFCNGVTLDDVIRANGVLFYIHGGSFNSGNQADIIASPPTSGPYGSGPGGANLVVWQAASNTNQLSLCCSNNATATFNGTVYAPTATVQLKNADMRIKQVIAWRVLFGPGGGTHSTIIGQQPTCPVSLDTASIPAWTVGRVYPNPQLAATCGSSPGVYRFTATGLPGGLTLGLTTGVISGTPTTAGTYTVTGKVTDSIGEQDLVTYTLRINPPPTISTASLPNWTINRGYPGTPVSVTAGTGTAPYAWSATGLPDGLSVNPTTGTVSGTPSTAGTFNPTITVTDVAGATVSRSYPVTINATPQITGPATLPNWTVGQTYPNQTMTRADGTTPFTWSASGLPTGLAINASTGVIGGTPTAAGTYSVTVSVTDLAGATASRPYSVKINPAPGIATASLPNGEQNRPYNFTLTPASGGTPPYTWTVVTSLPTGLTMSPTGTISGTPTGTGTFPNATIRITDSSGAFANTTYTMVIAPPVAISGPVTLPKPNWTVNRDYPQTPITATFGVAPFTWSATGLPPGMSIDASGVITGRPSATGTFGVVVTVTDALGGVATSSYSMVINDPPSITTSSLPDGEQGKLYSTPIAATQGTQPYTWAASGLPNGMAINTSNGTISGTPTVAGPFSITITVTDAAGASASQLLSLTLWSPPTISGSMPNGAVGVSYSAGLASTGGRAPFTWSATGLPAGLTMNATSGTVSGTPTAPFAGNVNVTVTDSLGGSAARTFPVTIGSAPTITTAAIPGWTVGRLYPSFTMIRTGGTAPFNWLATGLPDGLTMDAAGVITGTPTVTGTFDPVVTVFDSFGASNARSYSVTINPAPAISTSSLPDAHRNMLYSATVNGSGGATPYSWSATGLPGGLTMSTAGIISGTPTATGSFTVNVTLTDALGAIASRPLNLTVHPQLVVSAPSSLPPWTINRPYPTTTLTATGGFGAYTWSATGLPAGMTMSTSGAISGTPTVSGTFTANATVTDSASPPRSTTRQYTLTINPVLQLSKNNCEVDRGKATSFGVIQTDGTSPVGGWTQSGLSGGLTLNPTDGKISGNPNGAEGSSITVTIGGVDAAGSSSSTTFTITFVKNGPSPAC